MRFVLIGLGLFLLGCQPEQPVLKFGDLPVTEEFVAEEVPDTLYLYVIAENGSVILYSPVIGRVHSSGERNIPKLLDSAGAVSLPIEIGGKEYYTTELPNENGMFGEEEPYIWWIDLQGIKHIHYMNNREIVHVSSEKLPFNPKRILLNMEDIKVKR